MNRASSSRPVAASIFMGLGQGDRTSGSKLPDRPGDAGMGY
jgi:hypothetical protein